MKYEDLNEDVKSLLKGRRENNYTNAMELKAYDPELFKRIKTYKDSGLMSKSDIEHMFDNQEFPIDSKSVLSKSYDSLKAISEKPVPVEKPKERTAGEALFNAFLPRTYKRVDENIKGYGGNVVAGALDVASFPARISNTFAQAPIDTWNSFVGDKPSEQIPFSTIGNIGASSFQTPNLPSWAPDWLKGAKDFVNPVAEGIGEFGTSIARGPLIPGGPLARTASKFVPSVLPSALKTALGVVGNAGVGAGLGTSESVARGEGFDPTGASIGAGLAAGIPLVGGGISSWANKTSNKTSIDNYINKLQKDVIGGTTAEKRFAQKQLDRIVQVGKEKYAQELNDTYTRGASTALDGNFTKAPTKEYYSKPGNEITKQPTLKQTIDKYTNFPETNIPGALSFIKYDPITTSLASKRPSTQLNSEDLIMLGSLGRALNSKAFLGNFLSGHTPSEIINKFPSAQDATKAVPSLLNAINQFRNPSDSTSR